MTRTECLPLWGSSSTNRLRGAHEVPILWAHSVCQIICMNNLQICLNNRSRAEMFIDTLTPCQIFHPRRKHQRTTRSEGSAELYTGEKMDNRERLSRTFIGRAT